MIQQAFAQFLAILEPLRDTWIWPGIAEVGKFIGTHLISGMIPAFFIAGAIAIFLDKQRITKLMGTEANPFIAYPVAALSGGVLTVCSCGVIPIFTGIMQQGAGIGPDFTFLMASPAVNLIALVYTQSLLGTSFMIWRAILVFFSAICIGLGMRMLCTQPEAMVEAGMEIVEEEPEHSDGQIFVFFLLLVTIMVTSTGFLDPLLANLTSENLLLPRLALIFAELVLLGVAAGKWFHRYEIILWIKKSVSLFYLIFPKVLGGIFLCGIIAVALPLTSFISFFETNDLTGNLLASFIGSMMYFGTIVGVTIVTTLKGFGMNDGPAMTLLLSAPAVSLPSVLALMPIAGVKRSLVFLVLVIIFSALSGLIFGITI